MKAKTRYEVQFNVGGEAAKVTILAHTPRQAYRLAKRRYTMDNALVRNIRTNTYWWMTEARQ